MKKVWKNMAQISVLTLCMYACKKDKLDDYNSSSVNTLSIDTTILNTYTVNLGSEFELDASVNQSSGNGELTYRWYYYPNVNQTTIPTVDVGNSAHLKMKIDMATGGYFLILETTDKKTGIKAFKKITLVVKRLTSEGWLLLTWNNNRANLSIVSSDNEVYRNFLVESQKWQITERPDKLIVMNDFAEDGVQPIAIRTSAPKLYFLDYNTFEINNTELDLFEATLGSSAAHLGTDMYSMEYYLWDREGKVYSAERLYNGSSFPTGFSVPLGGNYQASRFSIPTFSAFPVSSVFYDELGKRFMYLGYLSNTLLPFQAKPDQASFDMNNFTDKIEYTGLDVNGTSYVVARNTAGAHYLYTLKLENALNVYPATAKELLPIPTTQTAAYYTISGRLPLLYYILNNSIYLYRISEKTTSLLYTFPNGENVSAFQMFREPGSSANSLSPLINNMLAVSVNKGTEGIFYTFNLSPTGALSTGNYTTRNTGFDPIIDIAYKEQR